MTAGKRAAAAAPATIGASMRLGARGKGSPRRSRHFAISKEISRKAARSKSAARRTRRHRSRCARRLLPGRKFCRSTKLQGRFPARFSERNAGCGRSDARALSHLPGWRRGPAAHFWHAWRKGRLTMTLAEFNALSSARGGSRADGLLRRGALGQAASRPSARLAASRRFTRPLTRPGGTWNARTGSKPSAIIRRSAKSPRPDRSRTADGRPVNRPARASPTEDVKARLARANRAYFEKFGYIYIVCATGKTAEGDACDSQSTPAE